MQEILQKKLAKFEKSDIMHLFDDEMNAAQLCGIIKKLKRIIKGDQK